MLNQFVNYNKLFAVARTFLFKAEFRLKLIIIILT